MRLRVGLGVAAVALVVVCAVVLSSSYGGAGSGGGSNAAGPQTTGSESSSGLPDDPVSPAAEREKHAAAKTVRETYDGLGNAIRVGAMPLEEIPRAALLQAQDIKGLAEVCNLLSRDAREEAIDYARRSSGFDDIEWTCEKAVALLLRSVRVGGREKQVLRARVVSVNIDGDRATATLSFGKGVPLGSAPLVREDGKWRISATPGAVRRD